MFKDAIRTYSHTHQTYTNTRMLASTCIVQQGDWLGSAATTDSTRTIRRMPTTTLCFSLFGTFLARAQYAMHSMNSCDTNNRINIYFPNVCVVYGFVCESLKIHRHHRQCKLLSLNHTSEIHLTYICVVRCGDEGKRFSTHLTWTTKHTNTKSRDKHRAQSVFS